MMEKIKMDLHIHSVLSPCADLLMTPGNIIKKAEELDLDVIAITDHNSAQNVIPALKIAKKSTVNVIPGMEVETAEEIHLLTFFPDLDKIIQWQKIIYTNLPERKNDEEYFGYQIITDENDEFMAKENRLLATAVKMNISEIVEKVSEIGGVIIPSHIDRAYGIIKNLGFIPDDLKLSLLEISRNKNINEIKKEFPYLDDYIFIKNSDSHYLKDMKVMMEVSVNTYNFKNLFKSLKSNRFICK